MAGYSKELVVGAFLHRFYKFKVKLGDQAFQEKANQWYDELGKDEFRLRGSVDPEAIREYKSFLKEGKQYDYS